MSVGRRRRRSSDRVLTRAIWFQTGAVGDSEPGDDFGCSAAGPVLVSVGCDVARAILVDRSAITSDRSCYLDGD